MGRVATSDWHLHHDFDQATGRTTELVENAGPISTAELEEYAAAYCASVANAEMAVLTGSLPAGTPPNFYMPLLGRYSSRPVILECGGPELLDALRHRPLLVKPNREELSKTVGWAVVRRRALLSANAANSMNPWGRVGRGHARQRLRVGVECRTGVLLAAATNERGQPNCLGRLHGCCHRLALSTGRSMLDAVKTGRCGRQRQCHATLARPTRPAASLANRRIARRSQRSSAMNNRSRIRTTPIRPASIPNLEIRGRAGPNQLQEIPPPRP